MGYWEDRLAESQSKLTTKNIKATEAQLKKYYKKAMDDVIGQFEKTYQHLLSSMDEGKEPTPADLYNLDKYWQMQAQLKTKLQKLGDSSYKLMSGQFENQYKTIYESLSLPSGGAFNTITDENIKQMILQIWCADGKSWSQRIWTNTDKLQQALNDNLINCVLTGKKPTELKQMLMKDFSVSFNNADTIVRTEMAHIQTQAAMQRYRDYGITEVEILADKDERQCEVCGKLHKKRYPVGANVPIPAHPRCRCCIIPVVEDDSLTTLEKDDIHIYRSVGAKSRNYPVKAPDSNQHYKFAEGTDITGVKVIMGSGTNKPLREKYKIALRNGIKNPDEIQKLRGTGYVIINGKKRKVELHWYEAENERFEFKIKVKLDES